MKKFTLLLATIATATIGFAQTPKIPEFKNTPMILNADGSLGKLEKQTASVRDKGGSNPWANAYGGGMNKKVEFIQATGAASDVRVDPNVTLIFKASDAEVDPEGVFIIYEALVVKKTREVYVRKDYGRSVQDKQATLNFEKVEPGVYKIKPDGLQPGTEYGIVPNTDGASKIVYLFGTTGTKPKGKKK